MSDTISVTLTAEEWELVLRELGPNDYTEAVYEKINSQTKTF